MTRKDLGTLRWKQIRKQILTRDQHTCYICQGEATQVDHIIPKVQGGDDSPGNLAAICASCNGRKGIINDKPKVNRKSFAHSTDFSMSVPPTRISAHVSLPKPVETDRNPFQ